jgi:hypothetical protein
MGTQSDNVRDMMERGRDGHGVHMGADHPRARLTAQEVEQIRQARSEGVIYRVLGARFGIGISQVARICKGTSWVMPPAMPLLNQGALSAVQWPQLAGAV